jgi:hypothetical protein
VLYEELKGEVGTLAGFPLVTSCFFPIRYTTYTGEQQLNDTRYTEETDKDRAALDNFAFSVNSQGGLLDTAKLSFRSLKDTRPLLRLIVSLTVSYLPQITQMIFQY